jgi:hypothetical protein
MHKKDAKSSGTGSHPRGIHPTASGRWMMEEFFCLFVVVVRGKKKARKAGQQSG